MREQRFYGAAIAMRMLSAVRVRNEPAKTGVTVVAYGARAKLVEHHLATIIATRGRKTATRTSRDHPD